MGKFQKLISCILIVAILGPSFGMMTGCDSGASGPRSENQRAIDNANRYEAESRAVAAHEDARRKQAEADRQELENAWWFGTAIGTGLGLIFSGGDDD